MLGIGGSITCGAGTDDPNDGGYNKKLSWTGWLERSLNDAFPCTDASATPSNGAVAALGNHTVVNGCRPASAADFWADKLSAWIHDTSPDDPTEELKNPWSANATYDVVVFEGAINDTRGADQQETNGRCLLDHKQTWIGCWNIARIAHSHLQSAFLPVPRRDRLRRTDRRLHGPHPQGDRARPQAPPARPAGAPRARVAGHVLPQRRGPGRDGVDQDRGRGARVQARARAPRRLPGAAQSGLSTVEEAAACG